MSNAKSLLILDFCGSSQAHPRESRVVCHSTEPPVTLGKSCSAPVFYDEETEVAKSSNSLKAPEVECRGPCLV